MKTEKYTEQKKRLPDTGKRIVGRVIDDCIIVYQAFNASIAAYAVKQQKFVGPHYSFNRMSWIKPGFLWMIYRAGWAGKEHRLYCICRVQDNYKYHWWLLIILTFSRIAEFAGRIFCRTISPIAYCVCTGRQICNC